MVTAADKDSDDTSDRRNGLPLQATGFRSWIVAIRKGRRADFVEPLPFPYCAAERPPYRRES